jgi:hypothetical protein
MEGKTQGQEIGDLALIEWKKRQDTRTPLIMAELSSQIVHMI